MYRFIFRAFLSHLPPERAHALAGVALRALAFLAPLSTALARRLRPQDPRLRVEALGMSFASPLGLAAGVDSSARWLPGLSALGFGFIEVGTVTARPQQGNPKPRVFRLLDERAILNKRGFPNDGAAAVAKRLRSIAADPIIGVNVGKSAAATLDEAGADYRAAVRLLGPLARYLVLNVSSPNTPKLRELQSVQRLQELIEDVRAELSALQVSPPLLVKLAPDLSDGELIAIAELAISLELDGIIAVNTTIDRGCLATAPPVPPEFGGGISGPPLKRRAEQVLELLAEHVRGKVTLISVGGIDSAEDVIARLQAGATLVQAHTAFVYDGPLWPFEVTRALSRALDKAGARSIADLRGSGAARPMR